MDKVKIKKKIDSNRDLIERFLSSNMSTKNIAGCVKMVAKNNENLIKIMDYFDSYKDQLIHKKIPEKKATYIANKVCNRMRKQPFCISGLYIEGLNFKLGCKTVECGQLIQETFTTYDKEKISFQFYFH